MAEPLDLLLEMAWKRYDESNQERRDMGVTSGTLLAADGILLGLCLQGGSVQGWTYGAIIALLISAILAVLVFIGQRYKAIDTINIWDELATDSSVKTDDDFQERIIAAICAIESANTEATQRLWLPLNAAIAELISAVIFLSFSLL